MSVEVVFASYDSRTTNVCSPCKSQYNISLFHITIAIAVWLSYDHYFENIACFRRAVARPPSEIVKPYNGRRPTSQHVNFCCEIRMISEATRQSQGCRKADSRRSYKTLSWHPGWTCQPDVNLSLIHISEPTRPLYISYAVFCLKKEISLVAYFDLV